MYTSPGLVFMSQGDLVGGHPGAYQAGLVPADGVEGQGGAMLVGVDDLPVGHQAQLDEGLEAVADAQHQAVPVFQQVMDLILQLLRIAEEGGDELGRAVGLVAAGEAAGEEDDLGSGPGFWATRSTDWAMSPAVQVA